MVVYVETVHMHCCILFLVGSIPFATGLEPSPAVSVFDKEVECYDADRDTSCDSNSEDDNSDSDSDSESDSENDNTDTGTISADSDEFLEYNDKNEINVPDVTRLVCIICKLHY